GGGRQQLNDAHTYSHAVFLLRRTHYFAVRFSVSFTDCGAAVAAPNKNAGRVGFSVAGNNVRLAGKLMVTARPTSMPKRLRGGTSLNSNTANPRPMAAKVKSSALPVLG